MRCIGSPMEFFNLSLHRRLLLAIVPSAVLWVLSVFFNTFLWDSILYAYAAMFGALVMAPFITSHSMIILRFSALVAVPVLMASAWFYYIDDLLPGQPSRTALDALQSVIDVVVSIIFDVNGAYHSAISGVLFYLAHTLLLTLGLAFSLLITAPLRVSWKYWIYIFLSSLLSTALFIVWLVWFFRLGGYPWWYDSFFILAFSVWPLSFCAAVYFGRVNNRQTEEDVQ